MTIEFNCGNCGKNLQAPEEKTGKTGKCPDCGEPIIVPEPALNSPPPENPFAYEDEESPYAAPPREIETPCPMCGASVSSRASTCPSCGEVLASETSGTTGFSSGHLVSVSNVISTAWARYEQQRGITIGGVLVVGLISFGGRVLSEAAAIVNPALGGLIVLGAALLNLWVGLGLARLLLKVARGEQVELELLFTGGPYFGRALLASIVYFLVVFVIAVVAILLMVLLASAVGAAAFVIAPVFIIGLLVFGMMFWWYQYILVDIDPPGISCLSLSREIMAGNYLAVILISICSSLIAAIGFFVCVVGLIFTVPFSALIMAVTYDHLTGGHDRFDQNY